MDKLAWHVRVLGRRILGAVLAMNNALEKYAERLQKDAEVAFIRRMMWIDMEALKQWNPKANLTLTPRSPIWNVRTVGWRCAMQTVLPFIVKSFQRILVATSFRPTRIFD